MKQDAPTLASFIPRTLPWLPVCLAAWHFGGKPHSTVVRSGIVSGFGQPGQVAVPVPWAALDRPFIRDLMRSQSRTTLIRP